MKLLVVILIFLSTFFNLLLSDDSFVGHVERIIAIKMNQRSLTLLDTTLLNEGLMGIYQIDSLN